jgi:DNA-binding GntR family transcriptional regulator
MRPVRSNADRAPGKGRTKAEEVFTRLQADILSGRLKPGQRLRYSELCERYGTSMGVLREGMLRLAEQGLVQNEPQQGFRVTPLAADDLLDLTVARKAIESLALRHAIAEGDVTWESELIAAHHRLSRIDQFASEDPDRFSEDWAFAHNDFHNHLFLGGNNRLSAIARSLRDSAELYWRWSLPLGHEPGRDIPGEHRALLEATIDRDADRAVAELTAHIDRTTNLLLKSLSETPPSQ